MICNYIVRTIFARCISVVSEIITEKLALSTSINRIIAFIHQRIIFPMNKKNNASIRANSFGFRRFPRLLFMEIGRHCLGGWKKKDTILALKAVIIFNGFTLVPFSLWCNFLHCVVVIFLSWKFYFVVSTDWKKYLP